MMRKHLVSVSPWILAAACTLLTIIIGVFAVNNYSREKQLMKEALLQKGLTIIRFIDTGVRVSLRANMRNYTSGIYRWTDHVQSVIDQIHDQPDIHFVLLVDPAGTILAGTNADLIGTTLDPESLKFIYGGSDGAAVYRMVGTAQDNQSAFQVARVYFPTVRGPGPHAGMPGMNMSERMFRGNGAQRWQQELERLRDMELALLVELDLDQFNTAVKRQLLQIIILSVILLLVGIGGWLSLITLQGLKGSQTRLRNIRALNDILVESLPVGLIVTDNRGSIQMVNAAAEEITGISSTAVLGRKPQEALPNGLVQRFRDPATTSGDQGSVETVIANGEGHPRTLLLTGLPVVDDEHRPVGDVLLIQDLSEMKMLEAELQRNERLAALGKMAAGVAHELRNPLSSIKGLTVLLTAKISANSEDRKTADILVQEVERLNRSIGELLDYAKPEKLEKSVVSLGEVLEKTLTLVGMDAKLLGITVSYSHWDGTDTVFADRDKLNQVFLNLFLNAIQAMSSGGTLKVRTAVEGESIVCCIEDSGVGIPQENLSRVFDPYFTTKNDGTGLGLAMSAKIVEEHGGSITLDSIPASGTKVYVTLPLQH